jgi:hypothetical protein
MLPPEGQGGASAAGITVLPQSLALVYVRGMEEVQRWLKHQHRAYCLWRSPGEVGIQPKPEGHFWSENNCYQHLELELFIEEYIYRPIYT